MRGIKKKEKGQTFFRKKQKRKNEKMKFFVGDLIIMGRKGLRRRGRGAEGWKTEENNFLFSTTSFKERIK